jgi:histidinol-phosphate aminotransferase
MHLSSSPRPGARFRLPLLLALQAAASTLVWAQLEVGPTQENSPTRLSSNENAFGFTPRAKQAMIANIDAGSYYNRNEIDLLEELCAQREGVPRNYILSTPGSGPVLMMTALAYAEPGKNVVTTAMGYTQLTRKFEERGGSVKYAPLGADMGYDFEALRAQIDKNTVIVYICNPNNPTGVLSDPMALKQFVLSVPPEILVFVDEAYLELAETPFAANTAAPLVRMRKNMIVSRTFSKSFGMAGFRIGYGIAHPDILAKIRVFHMGGPTYLTAIAAQEALRDTAYMDYLAEQYRTVRRYTCERFDAMGIRYAQSSGAFVFFQAGMEGERLREEMALRGILISGSRESGVEIGTYGDWARVSIGTKAQMDEFFTALESILPAAKAKAS